jgi:hypothetical protein
MYVFITITILGIIHRPFFIYQRVYETGFCLRFQVDLTQLGPINRASLCLGNLKAER